MFCSQSERPNGLQKKKIQTVRFRPIFCCLSIYFVEHKAENSKKNFILYSCQHKANKIKSLLSPEESKRPKIETMHSAAKGKKHLFPLRVCHIHLVKIGEKKHDARSMCPSTNCCVNSKPYRFIFFFLQNQHNVLLHDNHCVRHSNAKYYI